MSSTFCEYWSALITGSDYSHIRLERTDSDLLRPWASRRYAKVLLVMLDASNSSNLCMSAICRQWYAWEQSNLKIKFFPAMCCAASVSVLTG